MAESTSGLVAILDDGRRVKFSLQKRERDPNYFACFTGPTGKRLQRTTSETSQRLAKDSAAVVIRETYNPVPLKPRPTWEMAVQKLRLHANGAQLRKGTVDQYVFAVRALQDWSKVECPTDVTPEMAERFKVARIEQGLRPRTVAGNLDNLRIVYGHWWKETCRIVNDNPFENVKPPKEDKQPPRVVSDDEFQKFIDWLKARWPEFRLPILLLEVKARIGCRIGELCAAKTGSLAEGRIGFTPESTKGRKERLCRLPETMFEELKALAGKQFVFESFADGLRAVHRRQGHKHSASLVGDFTTEGLKKWIQHQLTMYRKATGATKFKLHNLRGTAMSRARMAGVQIDEASIAFGCNPHTMRQHYLNLDETRISDDVFSRI